MRTLYLDATPDMLALFACGTLTCPPEITLLQDGPPPLAEIPAAIAGYDLVLIEHTPLPTALLAQCRGLRGVIFMGTGIESYVDRPAAEALGLQVTNVPGYGDQTLAEFTLALLLAAARSVAVMDRAVRAGGWTGIGGLQLAGSRLAVIGLGGIGRRFAALAEAIGMRVVGWNRTPLGLSWQVDSLDAALTDADAVSLHLAVTHQTTGLIDARRLALPKRGFLLVNTARGALLDQAALAAALQSGQVGHAALDVFATEPLPPDDALRLAPNTTFTPHAAYMTEAAYVELWRRTLAKRAAMIQALG